MALLGNHILHNTNTMLATLEDIWILESQSRAHTACAFLPCISLHVYRSGVYSK